jgi:hypothetical protein
LSLKKSVTFDIIGFIEKIGDKNLPKNLKMGLKIGSYLSHFIHLENQMNKRCKKINPLFRNM